MKKIVNGLNITYRYVKGKTDVVTVLLHGWGGNLNSFRFLENDLISKNYSILTVDFPGFGGSDLPNENFELEDYYKIILELLRQENISKINIVAHSFGGRVAILLASKNPELINKLVFVDVAGIKPKFSLSKFFKVRKYKILKWLNQKGITKKDLSKYGSDDYKAMPEKLRPVFSRIVNQDLSDESKQIKAPTILIWGKNDESTPLYMAKKLKKNIRDSEIILFDGGHFAYLQNANKFLLIVNSFLKENIDANI